MSAVVLLPGLLNDARLWQHQSVYFADEREVIVPDLTQSESIHEMAEKVLDETRGRIALAGLSMGGYVALEIIKMAPDRVCRLALFDTSARLDSPERRAERISSLKLAEEGKFLGVSRKLLPRIIHEKWVDTEVGETVIAMGKTLGKAVFIRQQQAILARRSQAPFLRDIAVPTLVAIGDSDKVTPIEESVLMAREIPQSALHIIETAGHLPPLEQPDATNHLLKQWLMWQ